VEIKSRRGGKPDLSMRNGYKIKDFGILSSMGLKQKAPTTEEKAVAANGPPPAYEE